MLRPDVGRPRHVQRVLRLEWARRSQHTPEGFESGEIYKMIQARFAVPLALGALGSCCALGDEVVLQASKDNTIYSQSDLLSDGAGSTLFVGQTSSHGARRALIAFDLASSIPTDASIDSAQLSFTVSSFKGFQTITLHRLLTDWGEGASDAGDFGGAGAPAQDGDATWRYHHFFADGSSQPWNTPGGDFVAAESAHGNAAAMTFELGSTPEMIADVQKWRTSPSANFGWILVGEESLSGGADRLDSRDNLNPTFRPTLTIDYSMPGPPPWKNDSDGSWGDSNNWSAGIPDSPTAIATLPNIITADRTITLDGNRTVAVINFDAGHSYTIAPGTGGSLVVGPQGGGMIHVASGSHFFTARVDIAGQTEINLADNSTLELSGGLTTAFGAILTKTGGGQLLIGGAQQHALQASLTVSDGRVVLNSNAGAPASGGTASVANLALALTGNSGGSNSTVILNSDQDLQNLDIAYHDEGAQGLDLHSTATA